MRKFRPAMWGLALLRTTSTNCKVFTRLWFADGRTLLTLWGGLALLFCD